jgi:hypothetical protein
MLQYYIILSTFWEEILYCSFLLGYDIDDDFDDDDDDHDDNDDDDSID